MKKFAGIALAAAVFAVPAQAAIVVDGSYDAGYGAARSTVTYDPNAPLGNFGTGGTTNHNAGYEIYLTSTGGTLFGFFNADRDTNGLSFANLYFDLDYATRSGSDLGFEITNKRAFRPGVAGFGATPDINFAISADGRGFEFSIPETYFTGPIAGIAYHPNLVFPATDGSVRLNLSQSFGYSVAGHTAYGANRLGVVELSGAVPEPSTWAMMIGGFGLVGGALRSMRRRRPLAVA
jgi:opacity protein-like surface antigen